MKKQLLLSLSLLASSALSQAGTGRDLSNYNNHPTIGQINFLTIYDVLSNGEFIPTRISTEKRITEPMLETFGNEMQPSKLDQASMKSFENFKKDFESTIADLSGGQRRIVLAHIFNDILHAPVNASDDIQ